jgi:hypothetical protein
MEHYCVQLTPSAAAAWGSAAVITPTAADATAAGSSDSTPESPALLEALQAYPVVNITRAAASKDAQQAGKKGTAAAAAAEGDGEGLPSAAASVLRAAAAAAQQKQQAPAVRLAECWVERQGLYVVVQATAPTNKGLDAALPGGSEFIPGESSASFGWLFACLFVLFG